jgi:hypothetical protein
MKRRETTELWGAMSEEERCTASRHGLLLGITGLAVTLLCHPTVADAFADIGIDV